MKLKRILFCLLIAAILILSPAVVLAEEGDTQEKTEEELAAEAEAQEKAASYEAEIDTNGLEKWPGGPKVYADSAVVMDMESGAILYGKNMDAKHFPASITKLLTTLVALENADLTDKVKFTEDSISFLQYDDAQIGMKVGEELSLEDSLHAVLLASANEVSHAVAESVGELRLGGNYDTFIQKMNDRAKELGCTNSHWVNPNGLHDDEHYTTAHDMALIASAVYQQEEFRTIMGKLEYKIGPTNLTQEERVFQQNHKMLWPENYYYYEYCTGGKTGYTDQAKTTLVTMADNGDMHLAAVVLYDYGVDAYNDTRAIMDYVFSNFKKVPVENLEASEDINNFNTETPYVVLPDSVDFFGLDKNIVLTENGIRDGKVIYTYKGQAVGSAEVTLTEQGYQKLMGDTAASDSRKIENKQDDTTAEPPKVKKDEQPKLKFYIGIGAAAVLIILIAAGAVALHGRKRGRKR